MRPRYEPVALTAAITGGDVLPSQSPFIPCGAQVIIEDAVRAAEAGASAVHIHCREADGKPTASAEMFAEIGEGIRARSNVVVNFTTGGAPGMTADERIGGIALGKPEMATFNLGTMNYHNFPNPDRWPKVESEWEQAELDGSDGTIALNTLTMLRRFAGRMKELGITPELEAYDLSHLSMARFLIDERTLEPPVRVQFVLGPLGAADNSLDTLFHMKHQAERILGSDLGSAGVAATGYPMQFRHAAVALGWGLDVRVGLEDSIRVRRDRMAQSNAELVEVACQLADLLGRPIMTPDELRASLGPWHGTTA